MHLKSWGISVVIDRARALVLLAKIYLGVGNTLVKILAGMEPTETQSLVFMWATFQLFRFPFVMALASFFLQRGSQCPR